MTPGFAVLLLAPGLAGDPQTLALAALCTRLGFPLVAGVALDLPCRGGASITAAASSRRRSRPSSSTPSSSLRSCASTQAGLAARHGRPPGSPARRALRASRSSPSSRSPCADGTCRFGSSWPRFDRAHCASSSAAVALTVAASSATALFVIVGDAGGLLHALRGVVALLRRSADQLPFGIVASVVGVVLLPELARHHAAGRDAALVERAEPRPSRSPASSRCRRRSASRLCAETIVAVLFERGAFGADDTLGTARALQGLASGSRSRSPARCWRRRSSRAAPSRHRSGRSRRALVATAAAALLSPERSGGLSPRSRASPPAASLTPRASPTPSPAPACGGRTRRSRGASSGSRRRPPLLAAALLGLRALALPANLASPPPLLRRRAAVYAAFGRRRRRRSAAPISAFSPKTADRLALAPVALAIRRAASG